VRECEFQETACQWELNNRFIRQRTRMSQRTALVSLMERRKREGEDPLLRLREIRKKIGGIAREWEENGLPPVIRRKLVRSRIT